MQLLRSLTSNLFTLSMALVLAVVIWVTAVQADDPIVTRTYEVPISFINTPANAILDNQSQDTVQIGVSGPESQLNQISGADIDALADLSNARILMNEAINIEVQFRSDEVNANQLDISTPFPSQIIINIDVEITGDVPVVVTVRGDVARGHASAEAFADPAVIQVTGPSQRVNQLAEARVTVILDNEREDVVASRRPIFYDQSGNVARVSDLRRDFEQVTVTVPIAELARFATKPVTVNWVGEPDNGYRLLDASATPDSILVTGSPAQLEALGLIQTEPVDISGLKESITQRVALDLPAGIELVEVQPIIVEIIIEPIFSTSIIQQVPEVRALSEGLTATLSVDEIRIVLAGPLPILDTLVDDDVRVTLDLFDREVGVYTLEPTIDVFADDLEVRSIQPPRVTVTITQIISATDDITGTLGITGTIPVTTTNPIPGSVSSMSTTTFTASTLVLEAAHAVAQQITWLPDRPAANVPRHPFLIRERA